MPGVCSNLLFFLSGRLNKRHGGWYFLFLLYNSNGNGTIFYFILFSLYVPAIICYFLPPYPFLYYLFGSMTIYQSPLTILKVISVMTKRRERETLKNTAYQHKPILLIR